MRFVLFVLTGIAVLAAAAAARADEVVLKNGQTIEGVATEKDGRVVVELGFGTLTLEKSQVQEIVRRTSSVQEFEERQKSASTAEEHYQAGLWAAEQGLNARAQEQYRRALAIDPAFAPARRQLGFVEHEGQWLTRDQYMALKGFTEHEGRWIPWDLYEKIMRNDLQTQADRERLHVLDSLFENRGQAGGLPRFEPEERFERVVAPRRAPWNWGVRRDR